MKKCYICGKSAEFKISGSNDFYCKDCAIDLFGDLSCLVKIEKEVKLLKKFIDDKLDDFNRNENQGKE